MFTMLELLSGAFPWRDARTVEPLCLSSTVTLEAHAASVLPLSLLQGPGWVEVVRQAGWTHPTVLRAKTEFVHRPRGRADLLRASHTTGLMHRL